MRVSLCVCCNDAVATSFSSSPLTADTCDDADDDL